MQRRVSTGAVQVSAPALCNSCRQSERSCCIATTKRAQIFHPRDTQAHPAAHQQSNLRSHHGISKHPHASSVGSNHAHSRSALRTRLSLPLSALGSQQSRALSHKFRLGLASSDIAGVARQTCNGGFARGSLYCATRQWHPHERIAALVRGMGWCRYKGGLVVQEGEQADEKRDRLLDPSWCLLQTPLLSLLLLSPTPHSL